MTYGSLYVNALIFVLGLFTSMVSMNTIFTVQTSIVPDFYPDRKGEASGVVAGLSQGGNLLGMIWIIWTAAIAYQWTYLLFVVSMVIAGTIVVLSTKERPTDQ